MKIVVLGGAGAMGSEVVKDLVKGEDVSEVVVADLRAGEAARLATLLGSKALAQSVDVTDHQALVQLMSNADVVVNCVGPYYEFGLHILRAAIEARTDYVDICDDPDTTVEMLDLDEEAKNAGITCVVGLGTSPGTSNIMAKHGADKLDRTDEIHIYWMTHRADPAARTPAQLLHGAHCLDGMVTQFLDGQWVKVPALSGGKVVDFGEPAGQVETGFFGHPEPMTLPRYIKGIKAVTNRGTQYPAWAAQQMKCQVLLGLFSTRPIKVKGVEISPREFMSAYIEQTPPAGEWGKPATAMKIEVIGERSGEPKTIVYGGASGLGGEQEATGWPASIGAQMLGRGEIKVKGVVPPEACIDFRKFMTELGKRGVIT